MKDESQRRHGLATINCLLSSQKVFAPSYSEAESTLRVLRGLHGFHMYATEFWVDYLLAHVEFDEILWFESKFFRSSCLLAENFASMEPDKEAMGNDSSNLHLTAIRQKHYPLYKMARMILLEQNKEMLEATSIHGTASTPPGLL